MCKNIVLEKQGFAKIAVFLTNEKVSANEGNYSELCRYVNKLDLDSYSNK